MKTAYQTGPGFYAADTDRNDKTLPPGTLRVHCIRLEAYDLPAGDASLDNITFEIVFAKAENNPTLARALLKLRDAITGNETLLQEIARQ